MDAYEVLVIILSVVLGIFLLMAIVIAVFLLQILIKVKKVADRAEGVIHDIEDFSWSLRKVEPFRTIKAILTFIASVKGNRRDR